MSRMLLALNSLKLPAQSRPGGRRRGGRSSSAGRRPRGAPLVSPIWTRTDEVVTGGDGGIQSGPPGDCALASGEGVFGGRLQRRDGGR